MEIKNVVVAGSGVLGAQIAFQVAFKRFNVTVYDINDAVLGQAKVKMAGLETTYQAEIHNAKAQFTQSTANLNYNTNLLPGLNNTVTAAIQQSEHAVDSTLARITYTSDLKKAVSDADLVIEAIPEVVTIKQSFYQQLAPLAPKKNDFRY